MGEVLVEELALEAVEKLAETVGLLCSLLWSSLEQAFFHDCFEQLMVAALEAATQMTKEEVCQLDRRRSTGAGRCTCRSID